MTFTELVLRYTNESESPKKYYYWSSLVAIAAVVRDKVFLDKFYYKLYPNIYVILVGRSGLRKGPPVNLAKSLVNDIDVTRLYAGRMSIQGVISDLSKARTKANGGPPLTDATAALFASEFASFIISDSSALTILTDLYDGHYNPEWSYMLRNSPTEKLKAPCITLFGASNEAHLKDAVPENAVGGGFIARTFIIYSDKKSGINPLTDRPADTIPYDTIRNRLKEISRASGEFIWDPEGKEIYNEWYRKFQEVEGIEDDTTGTMERLHDHILKTAMLVSLSRNMDMKLVASDITESIKACTDFVPGAKRLGLGQMGKSVSAPGTAVLLRELILNPAHEMSKTAALQRHWQHFDTFELDRIAESLYNQKAINIVIRRGDNGQQEPWYVLKQEVLKRYMEREEKKKDEQ